MGDDEKGLPQQAEGKALGSAMPSHTSSQPSLGTHSQEGADTAPKSLVYVTINLHIPVITILKYRSNLKVKCFQSKALSVKPASVKNCLRGF